LIWKVHKGETGIISFVVKFVLNRSSLRPWNVNMAVNSWYIRDLPNKQIYEWMNIEQSFWEMSLFSFQLWCHEKVVMKLLVFLLSLHWGDTTACCNDYRIIIRFLLLSLFGIIQRLRSSKEIYINDCQPEKCCFPPGWQLLMFTP
jgi:hypothetical protein